MTERAGRVKLRRPGAVALVAALAMAGCGSAAADSGAGSRLPSPVRAASDPTTTAPASGTTGAAPTTTTVPPASVDVQGTSKLGALAVLGRVHRVPVERAPGRGERAPAGPRRVARLPGADRGRLSALRPECRARPAARHRRGRHDVLLAVIGAPPARAALPRDHVRPARIGLLGPADRAAHRDLAGRRHRRARRLARAEGADGRRLGARGAGGARPRRTPPLARRVARARRHERRGRHLGTASGAGVGAARDAGHHPRPALLGLLPHRSAGPGGPDRVAPVARRGGAGLADRAGGRGAGGGAS